MNDIINEILKWPIIIQGALGSCLFWIFLAIGQKVVKLVSNKYTSNKKLGNYFIKEALKSFKEQDFERSTFAFFSAIYASLHYFLKFILVVFIGFLVEQLIPVFGYIGYLLGFYFLFRSLSYLPNADTLDFNEIEEDNE